MACHLAAFTGHFLPVIGNIGAPLLIWVLKKDTSPFIDDQGKESINAQISLTLYVLVATPLCYVLIGFLLLPLLYVAALVLIIVAAVRANDGVRYRYPGIIRAIK